MRNNWVNIGDFWRVFEKIKEGGILPVLKKLAGNKQARIKASWQHTRSASQHWWSIPAVKARLNRLASGDPQIDQRTYIKRKYLDPRKDLTALSLGCGIGQNEIAWAELGNFSRIDALDISGTRIAFAKASAQEKGLGHIIHFATADVLQTDLGKGRYDLVLFEGSLHHFYPVAKILSRVHAALKPDGYLVISDFVGPSRFQWSDRQLELSNGLLRMFPQQYRVKWTGQDLKKKVYRPGRLRMILSDPSEAADSSNILPCLQDTFCVQEMKYLGGTLLQLLLDGIAHHFIDQDPQAAELLDICFTLEDYLLKIKDIESDFALVVGRKKKGE